MSRFKIVAAAAFSALLATCGVAAAEVKVATSIAPAHSLAARVMQGVAEPTLILEPGASPHEFALKPSDAAALDAAELVIWIGAPLELWMTRPLESLAGDAKHLALAEVDGVIQLASREGGAWGDHHRHGGDDGHDEHENGAAQDDHDDQGAELDPHLWLDPMNAKIWLGAIAAALAELDPANAPTYFQNAAEARAEIDALAGEIETMLAPVRAEPFIVFHDAYQYFERRFDVNAVGSIALHDADRPSAARIQAILERIAESGARCVFAEPQFEPGLVATVTEGSDARAGALDPIGADIALGPAFYPTLLRNLAAALVGCLSL